MIKGKKTVWLGQRVPISKQCVVIRKGKTYEAHLILLSVPRHSVFTGI